MAYNFEEGARADVSAFSRMMAQTGERNAFGVHNEAYFATRYLNLLLPEYGTLLLARHQGDLLAAIMVFALGDKCLVSIRRVIAGKEQCLRQLRHSVGGDSMGAETRLPLL